MLLWVKSISLHKTVPSSWWDPIIWNYLKWFQSISSLQDSRGWDDSSSEVWESLHHRGAFAISNWGPHLADWGYTNLAINQQDIPVEHTFFLVKASFFSGEIAIQYHHIFLDQIAIFPGELTIFFLLKSPWNHHEITRFPRVFLCFSVKYHHFPMGFPRPKSHGFSIFSQASNGRRRPQGAAAHGLGRPRGASSGGRCEPRRCHGAVAAGPTGVRGMGRKEWRNHRKAIGKWWNHRKTIGKPIGQLVIECWV